MVTKSLLDEFVAGEGTTGKVEKDFEKFATHVLVSPLVEGELDVDPLMTGDGGDIGLDSISILVNGNVVLDPDDVDSLAELNQYVSAKFIFVQAKTSPSFATREVGQIEFGVLDFFSETPQLTRNENITQAALTMRRVFHHSRLFKHGNPSCSIFYATAGRWNGDNDVVVRIAAAVKSVEDLNLFKDVSFEPVDARSIQIRCQSIRNGIVREFLFQNRVPLPEIPDVDEAHIGFVSARSLLDLISHPDGTLVSSLFYDNVRDFQGLKNRVNTGISETLRSSTRSLFALMNNGVTIVAKDLQSTGNKFVLRDFQVVNGCQTCNVLAAAKESLDDNVLIPLRLIATADDEVKKKVITATNRQTEIRDEQIFVVNDFPKLLQDSFNSYPDDRRLYFERRSKEYTNLPVERLKIVDFNSVVRAFAAVYLEEPHRATRNFKAILDRVGRDIFIDGHRPEPYVAAASVLYRCAFLFKTGFIEQRLSPAKYHLMLAVRIMVSGTAVHPFNSKQAVKDAETLAGAMWDPKQSEELFREAVSDLSELAEDNFERDGIRTQGFTEKVLYWYSD
jgi:hypothetical protein